MASESLPNDKIHDESSALRRELDDLKIELSTAIEHGDAIEAQLDMEIRERRALEGHLRQTMADLARKNDEAEQANDRILEGINYASKILGAMLPDTAILGDAIKDIAVSCEPFQVVGGDCYWFERNAERSTIFIADCTGHGVPGAFMSLITTSAIGQICQARETFSPSNVLVQLDAMVRSRLHQDRPDTSSDDGLDAALCVWNTKSKVLSYAGAYIPLFYAYNGNVRFVSANRSSLGYRTARLRGPIDNHDIAVEPGMVFYLFTDGVLDQVGGKNRRLLGRKGLMEMIASHQHLPISEQMSRLLGDLADYRGKERQRDDMTLIIFQPI